MYNKTQNVPNTIEEIKIPDAAKIHEAKKLREARRNAKNTSTNPNFIPLELVIFIIISYKIVN